MCDVLLICHVKNPPLPPLPYPSLLPNLAQTLFVAPRFTTPGVQLVLLVVFMCAGGARLSNGIHIMCADVTTLGAALDDVPWLCICMCVMHMHVCRSIFQYVEVFVCAKVNVPSA